MEVKQRLFRLIKRIDAEDNRIGNLPPALPRHAEELPAIRETQFGKRGSSQAGATGDEVAALESSLRAIDNSLLDLDAMDTSDGFFSEVCNQRRVALCIQSSYTGSSMAQMFTLVSVQTLRCRVLPTRRTPRWAWDLSSHQCATLHLARSRGEFSSPVSRLLRKLRRRRRSQWSCASGRSMLRQGISPGHFDVV